MPPKAKTKAKHNPHAEALKDMKILSKEVKSLTKEVRKLKDLEYLKVFKHPWKFMGFSLLKGMMVGLGSVLGASVLVAVGIYILAQISFVPIVGDFVQEVMNQIEIALPSSDDQGEKSIFDQYNEATEEEVKD